MGLLLASGFLQVPVQGGRQRQQLQLRRRLEPLDRGDPVPGEAAARTQARNPPGEFFSGTRTGYPQKVVFSKCTEHAWAYQ